MERLLVYYAYLFTMLNKNVIRQLCTVDSTTFLRVDGIETVENISDVKYCSDATTDLISISKLGEIGFGVSFESDTKKI